MYLVVGLGNPGSRYETTRHNMGFMVADRLARELGAAFRRSFNQSHEAKARHNGIDIVILKPQTYMNLSGLAVHAAAQRHGIGPESIIVVYDDMDLDVGRLRIRVKGSAGGHNGMKSVVEHMATDAITRVRVGIGRHQPWEDPADYVLHNFTKEELPIVSDAIINAGRAILCIMDDGVDAAQTEFNK